MLSAKSEVIKSFLHISVHIAYSLEMIKFGVKIYGVKAVQFAQSCLTLCDPVDCSTPGFPVHHQLLEFTETHVH